MKNQEKHCPRCSWEDHRVVATDNPHIGKKQSVWHGPVLKKCRYHTDKWWREAKHCLSCGFRTKSIRVEVFIP